MDTQNSSCLQPARAQDQKKTYAVNVQKSAQQVEVEH